jgi:hypothetical protein
VTQRESFKAGFLLACADRGLSGSEATAAVEKAASILSMLASPVNAAAGLAPLAGVAIPAAAGVGAGYLAARATSPLGDSDDLQKQELIAELQAFARRARERKANKLLV